MKRSELKDKVLELGFYIVFDEDFSRIENGSGDTIMTIDEENTMLLDSDWSSFTEIDKLSRFLLFDLACEYAKTPIDQRKDTKIYYVQFFKTPKDDDGYLRYDEAIKKLSVGDKEETVSNQTKFTYEEVMALDKDYLPFIVLAND